MKTAALYYDFDSAEPFAAEIRELRPCGEGIALILDKTIFYPEGGGQGADGGTVNGAALLDVQEKEGEILHYVSASDAAALGPGPAVLILDAARRRDLTTQHTAQHLLSGTLLALGGGWTASMHLGAEICTIDVETPELGTDILLAAEEAAAGAIEEDAPLIIHHCPPENLADFPLRKKPPQNGEVVRVVEIAGHDFSPCCGTHLASTGRIGALHILGAEKYKGMTRVSFIAGRRVLRNSRMLRQNVETVSRALKVPAAETGKAVLALLEKSLRLEKQIKELAESAAKARARSLVEDAGLLAEAGAGRVFGKSFPDAGMEELLALGRAAQKLTGAALILASEPERKFAAFSAAKNADLKALLGERMIAEGGRGGGSGGFFQGLFGSGEELARFMESLPESTGTGAREAT